MPKEMRARTKKRTMMMIAIVSFSLTILAVFSFRDFLGGLDWVVVVRGRGRALEWKRGMIASMPPRQVQIVVFRSFERYSHCFALECRVQS